MKRLLNLFVFLLLALGLATAQTAVITRNVNLRPDPSTSNTPIEKLTPDTEIQLLEPGRTNGFFHVKVDDHTGWVWGNNVHIQQLHPTEASGAGATTGSTPATAISSDWSKPTPQDHVFQSDEGPCGKTGDDGDTDTNPTYNHEKVRISGWLMLDPEHKDMIDEGLRSTLWEIHPITKIEVWDNGQWIDLDTE